MKKTVTLLMLFFILIIIIWYAIMQDVQGQKMLKEFNYQYEKYLNTKVLGTDLASLINKTMDLNERNLIEKNENGYYIENETNSIKIYIKFEEDGIYFPMEKIAKLEISEFVKYFNLDDFTCSKINYHDETSRVSEVYFDII